LKPLGPADPTVIASYQILGVLGSGGMAKVYLARSHTGRRLAIKVIRADLAGNPLIRQRFAHEVAALRRVSPLFTAPIVDADTDAEEPWLATTFIDAPSLDDWVGGHGPLPGGGCGALTRRATRCPAGAGATPYWSTTGHGCGSWTRRPARCASPSRYRRRYRRPPPRAIGCTWTAAPGRPD
jgi:hypothetical protein